jgi:hypothetical protein
VVQMLRTLAKSSTPISHDSLNSRFIGELLPDGGVPFAFLGGNSLGDITDVAGHIAFIRSLTAARAPGGVLVFDYVGDRYSPSSENGVTRWPEIYPGDGGRHCSN